MSALKQLSVESRITYVQAVTLDACILCHQALQCLFDSARTVAAAGYMHDLMSAKMASNVKPCTLTKLGEVNGPAAYMEHLS
jgi:hypothetical protein